MKKLVITGATGLIGKHFVENAPESWAITAIVRSVETLPMRASLDAVVKNLSGNWSTEGLPDKVDVVIHLAQSDHFRKFPEKADDVFAVNVASVARLLDYARGAGAKKFILGSTGGLSASPSAFTTSGGDGQLSFYHAAKLCAETLARPYASLMDIVVLRFFFVYGPGQDERFLIPRLIESVKAGRPIILSGDMGVTLSPTHVSDAAGAVESAIDLAGSHIIDVAGPERLCLREMCETIGKLVGKKPAFDIRHDGRGPSVITGDISAMSRLLKPPVVKFSEGVGS